MVRVAWYKNSSVLEQWCYWLKNASEHTAEELRELLPGLAFLHATDELDAIREITEEKQMYDSREKAALDIQSNLMDARKEGRQEGRQEGRDEGKLAGKIQLLEQLLGLAVSTDEQLLSRSPEELASTMRDLQEQLRKRNA